MVLNSVYIGEYKRTLAVFGYTPADQRTIDIKPSYPWDESQRNFNLRESALTQLLRREFGFDLQGPATVIQYDPAPTGLRVKATYSLGKHVRVAFSQHILRDGRVSKHVQNETGEFPWLSTQKYLPWTDIVVNPNGVFYAQSVNIWVTDEFGDILKEHFEGSGGKFRHIRGLRDSLCACLESVIDDGNLPKRTSGYLQEYLLNPQMVLRPLRQAKH